MSSQIYSRYVPPKKKRKTRHVVTEIDALIEDTSPHTAPATEELGVEEVDDPRHKRLMEKREKSLKKAEKLARKAAKEASLDANKEGPTEEPQEPEELHDLVPLPQPDPVPEAPIQPASASLPPWLASPIRVSPNATAAFSEVGVQEDAAKILRTNGFKEAFAVQAAVLPLLLPGNSQSIGDILVSAATGSGKTLAYVLPMIENISKNTVTRLRGLIVMPTRELVTQAREVCEVCATVFSSQKRVKIGTAIGSEPLKAEQAALMEQELRYDPVGYREQVRRRDAKWETSDVESDGEDFWLCDDEPISSLPDHIINPISKVDILICTPGRLVEHLSSTPGFSLEFIKWFIVDEADKLLDQSFQQWIEMVVGRLGPQNSLPSRRNHDRVKKVILSATMTRDIGQLNSLKLFRPKLVVLDSTLSDGHDGFSQANILPDSLVESAIKTDDEGLKPLTLLELIEMQSKTNIPNSEEPRGVLIFTKSNESASRLARLLALLNPSYNDMIGVLTSTTSTSTRRKTIRSFNASKFSILVASDLVSRGLDLPNLAHVINYDMPSSVKNYVHRVGRTARAGNKGCAWTLVTPTQARWFWNEIARSKDIARAPGATVSRVNINTEEFSDELKRRYDVALEDLGREARRSTTKKSQRAGSDSGQT